jgi:putative membrane protein
MPAGSRAERLPVALLAATIAILVWSGIGPYDRLTWWLEVFPVLLAVPLLVATRHRFPLTRLVYVLIFLHAAILMIGGHYTYALTPVGFWMQELFGFARNHYDRIGHFAQGFVPAIIARELLLRKTPLRPGGWLFFLVLAVSLAISVFYEFIEWWASLLTGTAADAFLGTQGDVWDTQWDMFLAGCGAIAAQLFLARLHDHQLVAVDPGVRRKVA